ncbi:MAG: ComF family protein [Treponema sp.]|nr:ComF family protein [Treponema sp.]
MNFFYLIKNFFFPGSCVLCDVSLTESKEIHYGLCEKCHSDINYINENKCNICGKPLISEIETCLQCRNKENLKEEKSNIDRLWTFFPYMGKYRKLLTEYKFKKNLILANLFAELITEVIKNEPLFENIEIVPVPPRPGKIKNLGWDQVDFLVKKLKKQSNFTVNRCLKRKKSKIQKQLNRAERMENLKGRIFIKGKAPKTALIIDDVITTGSTMEVIAQVLKQAGTKKVYGLSLFYD